MKSSTHLDWIIAFSLFLVIVIVATNYVRVLTSTPYPEEERIEKAIDIIRNVFEENKIPLKIYDIEFSEKVLHSYPCEISILSPEEVSVVRNYDEKLVFKKSDNKVKFISDWPGRVMIIESNISTTSRKGDIFTNTSLAKNSNITITFNSTHLLNISYKQTRWLKEPSELGTFVKNVTSNTDGKIVFDNVNLTIDSFSTRIWIEGKGQDINFTIFFTKYCYINDSLYLCEEINYTPSFSDLLSFYNTSIGLSIIGDNNVTIYNQNNESIKITLHNVTKTEIFLQDGSYQLALNETEAFFSECETFPYLTLYAIPSSSLSSLSFPEGDFNYRIEVLGYSFGSSLPNVANVYRRAIPLLLYDNGVIKRTYAEVWVWG